MSWTEIASSVLLLIALMQIIELRSRVERLAKQNDRQLDMLIALLNRNGINPVTLD